MNTIELQLEIPRGSGTYVPVDLNQDTIFALNYTLSDLTNPTAVKNTYSANISIPTTPYNNDLFGNIWHINSTILKFNPAKRTNFRLYVNNNLFESGYIKLEEITQTDYQIRLFGNLGNFFYDLSEKKLMDLNVGTEFEHSLSADEFNKLWESNNGAYTYAMTYQGTYDNFDNEKTMLSDGSLKDTVWKSNGREYTPNNLTEHERTDISENSSQFYGEYRPYYQRPAVKISKVFQQIVADMEKQGYTINLDKDFFGENGDGTGNNPYYDWLWMLCPYYETGDSASSPAVAEEMGYLLDKNGTLIENNYSDGYFLSKDYNHFIDQSRTISTIFVPPSDTNTLVEINLNCKILAVSLADGDKRTNDITKDNPMTVYAFVSDNPGTNDTDNNIVEGGKLIWKFNNKDSLPMLGYHIVQKNSSAYKDYVQMCQKYPAGFNWSDFTYENKWAAGSGIKKADGGDAAIFKAHCLATIPASPTGKEYYLKFRFNGSTWWRIKSSKYARKWAIKAQFPDSIINVHDVDSNNDNRTGTKVDYKDMIGDKTTCLDFLLSYCKLFGLILKVDKPTGMVNILLRENYYKEGLLDWTGKVNRSKDITVEPTGLSFRRGLFQWNALNTKYEELYRSKYDSEYGSKKVDTGYELGDRDFNYLDGIIFDNCIIASETSPYFRDRSGVLYKDNKELPHYQDNSKGKVESSYSLAFYRNNENAGKPFLITDDIGSMKSLGYCWTNKGVIGSKYPVFKRTIIGDDDKCYSLNFGPVGTAYADSEQPLLNQDAGIYRYYWRSYLSDRLDDNSKILTCYVNLTPYDLQYDLLSKFIYIDNAVWIIDKIQEFNPLSVHPTKVTLIKVKDINNYLNRNNLSEIFTIRYNDRLIYDNATNNLPEIISIDETTVDLTLLVDSTREWEIKSKSGVTVTPLHHGLGKKDVAVNIPSANNKGFITFMYGSDVVTLEMVRERMITVKASATPTGVVKINGSSSSPQQVKVNSTVVFSATGTTDFLYWEINGKRYTSQSVAHKVTEDTTAVAYFLATNQVKLVCDDSYTTITNQTKTDNYWILTAGQSYTFINTQSDLSGFLFGDDSTYSRPGARTILSSDRYLYVYYNSVLLNLTVINNSPVAEFTGDLITLGGMPFDFDVPASSRSSEIASFETPGTIEFEKMEYHYPTFSATSFNSPGIYSLSITGNRVGWDGDKDVNISNSGNTTSTNMAYSPVPFTLNSNLYITPSSGSGNTSVTATLKGTGGYVRQVLRDTGFTYTLNLNQVVSNQKDIGWNGNGTDSLTVSVAADATSYAASPFYHNNSSLTLQSGLTKGGNNTDSDTSVWSSITATFTQNTSTSSKSHIFNITCNNKSFQLVIIQDGFEDPLQGQLCKWETHTMRVGLSGGTINNYFWVRIPNLANIERENSGITPETITGRNLGLQDYANGLRRYEFRITIPAVTTARNITVSETIRESVYHDISTSIGSASFTVVQS